MARAVGGLIVFAAGAGAWVVCNPPAREAPMRAPIARLAVPVPSASEGTGAHLAAPTLHGITPSETTEPPPPRLQPATSPTSEPRSGALAGSRQRRQVERLLRALAEDSERSSSRSPVEPSGDEVRNQVGAGIRDGLVSALFSAKEGGHSR